MYHIIKTLMIFGNKPKKSIMSFLFLLLILVGIEKMGSNAILYVKGFGFKTYIDTRKNIIT